MEKLIQILLLILIPTINFGQDFQLEYKPNKIRKEIRKIAKKIGERNEIHSKAIGYRGKRTSQYRNFEKLLKKSLVTELVELMNHPNPAVRGYAFWGLAKKHYKDLEEIFVNHSNDEELVFQISGCIGGEMPVIDFMRQVVMPQVLDIECKKLNNSAFKRVSQNRLIRKKMKN